MLMYVIRHKYCNHLFLEDLDKDGNPIWTIFELCKVFSKDVADFIRSFAPDRDLMKVCSVDFDINA